MEEWHTFGYSRWIVRRWRRVQVGLDWRRDYWWRLECGRFRGWDSGERVAGFHWAWRETILLTSQITVKSLISAPAHNYFNRCRSTGAKKRRALKRGRRLTCQWKIVDLRLLKRTQHISTNTEKISKMKKKPRKGKISTKPALKRGRRLL